MRIAIVNDLRIAVEALRHIVSQVPGYEVAWIAQDGAEALAKCKQDRPDLILMDLLMPVMDGVEATRRIMAECPCAICVVTATVEGNMGRVYQAMGHGALDAVNTPSLGPKGELQGAQPLLEKIATIARLVGKAPGSARSATAASARGSGLARATSDPLVLIGSSTGGPPALAEVLGGLRAPGAAGGGPATLVAPVVIVQHIDAEFAPGLATWLAEQSGVPVRVVAEGARFERGVALLAATNDHLVLRPDLTLGYTREPRDYPYRPSVDVFFQSVAERWPGKGVAALLTGMGSDGAEGLLALKDKGWHTIAQDQATSVIYGMPRAAAEAGAASEVLPLARVGQAILGRLGTVAARARS